MDKELIYQIVLEKIRELGAGFAFLDKQYLKILINKIVEAIEESYDI